MRPRPRSRARGFTLVELMVVVAIIGVLAALAMYGVRRYLMTAKSAEARHHVGAISRAAAAEYEEESSAAQILAAGGSSTTSAHALCASTGAEAPGHGPVPANIGMVQGTKYQPITADGADFQTGTSTGGWRCLRFTLAQPIYYQYHYNADGNFVSAGLPGAPALGAEGFEAAAVGDLDGDGVVATFARGGSVHATTGALMMATQVFVDNEFE